MAGLGLIIFLLHKLRQDRISPFGQVVNLWLKAWSADFSSQPIVTTTPEGKIVQWNRGAEMLLGYKENEVTGGMTFSELLSPEFRPLHDKELERYRKSKEFKLVETFVELEMLTMDGRKIPVFLNVSQFKIKTQAFYVKVIIDITKQKELRTRLEQLIRIYEIGEELEDTGHWYWLVHEEKVIATRGLRRLYDMDEEEIASVVEHLKCIHYQDRPHVDAVFKEVMQNKRGYEMEYRINRKNGKWIRIHAKGRVFDHPDEGQLFITGTVRKVGEQE